MKNGDVLEYGTHLHILQRSANAAVGVQRVLLSRSVSADRFGPIQLDGSLTRPTRHKYFTPSSNKGSWV
jgi:hypothetical protein